MSWWSEVGVTAGVSAASEPPAVVGAGVTGAARLFVPGSLRKCRRSSARSFAVVYRSDARFESIFQTDAFEFLRDRFVGLPGRARLVRRDLFQQLRARARLERPPPHEHFVEDDAEAEDVRAAIDAVPFAARLFRTHVGGRAGVVRPVPHVLFPKGHYFSDHR
jgi:hypothetical protein